MSFLSLNAFVVADLLYICVIKSMGVIFTVIYVCFPALSVIQELGSRSTEM